MAYYYPTLKMERLSWGCCPRSHRKPVLKTWFRSGSENHAFNHFAYIDCHRQLMSGHKPPSSSKRWLVIVRNARVQGALLAPQGPLPCAGRQARRPWLPWHFLSRQTCAVTGCMQLARSGPRSVAHRAMLAAVRASACLAGGGNPLHGVGCVHDHGAWTLWLLLPGLRSCSSDAFWAP